MYDMAKLGDEMKEMKLSLKLHANKQFNALEGQLAEITGTIDTVQSLMNTNTTEVKVAEMQETMDILTAKIDKMEKDQKRMYELIIQEQTHTKQLVIEVYRMMHAKQNPVVVETESQLT
jgi:hypothetical protein